MAGKKVGKAVASIGLITDVHTSQKNPLGMVLEDEAGNEFIYLTGVTSTAQYSWVSYDNAFLTTLLAADAVGLVAIAQAAVDAATKFGWYQITGSGSGKCDTIASGAACYIDGTAGRVDDATVSGDLVCGAFSRSADTSNVATFQLSRPFVTNILG